MRRRWHPNVCEVGRKARPYPKRERERALWSDKEGGEEEHGRRRKRNRQLCDGL